MSIYARLFLLAVAAAALAATGCGDTHVSLERERIALNKELMSLMNSSKDFNEILDKAPQVDSIAARLENLAERRKKLKEATAAEKEQINELRQAQAAEMRSHAEAQKSKFNPQSMLSSGIPDIAKMQKFTQAGARLAKAQMAYAPEQVSGAGGAGFLQAMPSFNGDGAPSGGGLPGAGLVPFPSGAKGSSP
ncbi:MAG TPA: hypothetical protein VFB96_25620 [Pirellulaceae bacterium]|nr:hypothetical protein [Pirellulaceae bacterium]